MPVFKFYQNIRIELNLATVYLFLRPEIRTEAVMQALALHNRKVPVMPLPSKRTSVNYQGQQRQRDRRGSGYYLGDLWN